MDNAQTLRVAEGLFETASSLTVLLTIIIMIVAGAVQIHAALTGKSSLNPEDVSAASPLASSAEKPFETVAVANYYNQALSRARISFWFSLVFASIGFGVIIFAFVSHSPADVTGTILKVVSGTVIDAISGLFLVQSTSSQKSMQEFFEKLRLDRMNAEAKAMIADVEDAERRDQLRAQMILKFAGIETLVVDKVATGQP